uniref:Uncharacterized protein n=1 Tax=Setaria digitata TaxID=48799 RepID=A0A915Q3V4_9BILA
MRSNVTDTASVVVRDNIDDEDDSARDVDGGDNDDNGINGEARKQRENCGRKKGLKKFE